MSSDNNALPARVVKAARKPHKCYACLCTIPAGYTYVAYPGKNDAGQFGTTPLCIECSYLLSQKTGATAQTIRFGEFSDRLIPNFLRKKRTAFRRNPQQVIRESGLLKGNEDD